MWLCLWCRPLRWCSGGTAELRRHLDTAHRRRDLPVLEYVDGQHRPVTESGDPLTGRPRTNVDAWVRATGQPRQIPETGKGGWQDRAACRTGDDPADTWHPSHGDTKQVKDALAVCARCPVIEPCLRYALDNGLRDGVWGGTTANQRRKLRELKGANP